VAHEALYLDRRLKLGCIDEGGTSIEIVPTQAVNEGLDWIESTFVENEVTREDVHCNYYVCQFNIVVLNEMTYDIEQSSSWASKEYHVLISKFCRGTRRSLPALSRRLRIMIVVSLLCNMDELPGTN
jgi:hypothetical protein